MMMMMMIIYERRRNKTTEFQNVSSFRSPLTQCELIGNDKRHAESTGEIRLPANC
jgi:hypothetical protein